MDTQLENIRRICDRCTCEIFNTPLFIRVERDVIRPEDGRIFIQMIYNAMCIKSGEMEEWHGRKWYLSDYMTDDEVVKTVWAAFKASVEHEMLEGFKVDRVVLFNPHVDHNELLQVSHKEVKRS
jgi:hypothetical protein